MVLYDSTLEGNRAILSGATHCDKIVNRVKQIGNII